MNISCSSMHTHTSNDLRRPFGNLSILLCFPLLQYYKVDGWFSHWTLKILFNSSPRESPQLITMAREENGTHGLVHMQIEGVEAAIRPGSLAWVPIHWYSSKIHSLVEQNHTVTVPSNRDILRVTWLSFGWKFLPIPDGARISLVTVGMFNIGKGS